MSRLRQMLSLVLLLGFGLASATGFCPSLHAWLEHGDGVVPHLHTATGERRDLSVVEATARPINISFTVLKRCATAQPKRSATVPHTHHGLSQLLLAGALEGAAAFPGLATIPANFEVSPILSARVFLDSSPSTLKAGRGPPTA